MKNEIFKNGDRVYHFVFGWGSVTGDSEKGVCDVVFEDKGNVTIPCKEIHLSFCKYDLINGGLSHERPFELEVGKSYVSDSGLSMIINLRGERDNYGLWHGNWVDDLIVYAPKGWREATDEEVDNALHEEAIKRFGFSPESKKIVKSVHDNLRFQNAKGLVIADHESEGWQVWNQYGCLFYKGEWAEPLEESESSEFETGEAVLIRDCPSENWRFNLFSHRDKGKTLSYAVIGRYYRYCIPYEGNEHLLNTSKFPES